MVKLGIKNYQIVLMVIFVLYLLTFFQNIVLKILEDLPIVDSNYFENPPLFSDTHWSYFNLPAFSIVRFFPICLYHVLFEIQFPT